MTVSRNCATIADAIGTRAKQMGVEDVFTVALAAFEVLMCVSAAAEQSANVRQALNDFLILEEAFLR